MNNRLYLYAALISIIAPTPHQTDPPAGSRKHDQAIPQAERITPHLYRIGKVMVDTAAGTVTVGGVVNMSSGAVEYLAVAPGGKTHESILRLDVRPLHLQLGLMLLDLEPINNIKFQGDSRTPAGPALNVRVKWTNAVGADISRRADELVDLTGPNGTRRSSHHLWSFTGSHISREVGFEADTEKSLIALWHDPAAVIDNPATDGAENAHAVSTACPRTNTPVEVEFSRLPHAPDAGTKR